MEEFKKVKNSIQEGKAPGPDGIPPEVFKRCNVDELILRSEETYLKPSRCHYTDV